MHLPLEFGLIKNLSKMAFNNFRGQRPELYNLYLNLIGNNSIQVYKHFFFVMYKAITTAVVAIHKPI